MRRVGIKCLIGHTWAGTEGRAFKGAELKKSDRFMFKLEPSGDGGTRHTDFSLILLRSADL